MARHSIITKDQILKTVKLLRYVSRRQLAVKFTGKNERMKILETALPELEREGRLVVTRHDGEKENRPPAPAVGRRYRTFHPPPCPSHWAGFKGATLRGRLG